MLIKPTKPYLSELNGILSLQFDEWSIQSEMSIDDTDELVIPYTRVMMSFLLIEPSPKHVAMIGLGGGSVAKYCYRYLPTSQVTAVEISAEVIALRNEFAIPKDDARFSVLLGDGALWVAETDCRPDVLIVDGFDADGLPAQLCSQAFYDDCYSALADNGILVVNIWKGYPRYVEYLSRLNNSFDGNTVIMDAGDDLNHIVLAVKNGAFPPSAASIRYHANLLTQSHALNFKAKANRLIQALPKGEA